MRSPEGLLRELRGSASVVIISAPGCPKCVQISEWLRDHSNGVLWKKVCVSSLQDELEESLIHQFVGLLKSSTGGRSYPFCFYGGEYIEDIEELKHLVFQNKVELKFEDL